MLKRGQKLTRKLEVSSIGVSYNGSIHLGLTQQLHRTTHRLSFNQNFLFTKKDLPTLTS